MYYMKVPCILLLSLVLSGCFNMFDPKKDLIASYKLNSTTEIEISSKGYGATTKDFTEIWKVTSNANELIKRIDGSYSGYKARIIKVNDTLFKVTFTDTSVFKGMSKSFPFNLNERVKE
jgi:hypothetical protein